MLVICKFLREDKKAGMCSIKQVLILQAKQENQENRGTVSFFANEIASKDHGLQTRLKHFLFTIQVAHMRT